jgi:hypothetical protein
LLTWKWLAISSCRSSSPAGKQAIDNRLLERLRDMIRRAEARHLLGGDKLEN